VADGVDAAVQAVQSPGLDPLAHRLTTQPKRPELRRGHDPMLSPRQPRQADVEFVNQRLTKSTAPLSRPPNWP